MCHRCAAGRYAATPYALPSTPASALNNYARLVPGEINGQGPVNSMIPTTAGRSSAPPSGRSVTGRRIPSTVFSNSSSGVDPNGKRRVRSNVDFAAREVCFL